MNPLFPATGFAQPAVDQLLDPAQGLTTFELSGLYFCPPQESQFIGATLFDPPVKHHVPKTGRVFVRKRVQDPNNPGARFERGGFQFQVIDQQTGQVVDTMTTDSKGHARSGDLPTGRTYILHELPNQSRPEVQAAADESFELTEHRIVLRPVNTVVQPGGYGTRP
jgi:hypothetical protein